MARQPKLTLTELQWLKEGQESWWNAAHTKWKIIRSHYFGDNEIPTPDIDDENSIIKEPIELHMTEGAEIADGLRGLLEAPSVIHAAAPGVGSRVQKSAEKLEAFGNAYMPVVEYEQEGSVEADTLFEVGLYGLTFVEVLPQPGLWKGLWPKQGVDSDGDEIPGESADAYNLRVDNWLKSTAPFPIRIRHRSAMTAIPVMDGKTVIQGIFVDKVPASWVMSRYRGELSDKDLQHLKTMKPIEEVEVISYCDDTRYGHYVTSGSGWGAELNLKDHKMPLPEGHAPVVAYRGMTTSDPAPERRYRGILDSILPTLTAMDFIATRQATMIGIYFWLTLIHRIKEAGADLDAKSIRKLRDFYFGGVNHLLPNEGLEVLGPPPNMPDAEALWGKLESRLRRHWTPALQGILEGKSSGYAYQIIRDTALRKVLPTANNVANGDADRLRMVCYALGGLQKQLNRKGPFTVYARYSKSGGEPESIGLSWAKAKEFLPLIRAKRDPDMPTDELSELDAVGKAIELKMPPNRAWTRYGNVEDPEQMEDEYIAHALEQSDPILARREQAVLQEMDLISDEELGEDLDEALANPDLPPAFEEALEDTVTEPPDGAEVSGTPRPGTLGASARSGQRKRPVQQPQGGVR